ncbi:MAG: bifunctional folylpolyglutamate synthase/dihydrofolate synthase [Actinomycetia bacterium]|nr:bifunctional folylpolyglutamate synthase/dihydrofolate synthase [Actinomycetes bacterium]
MDLLESLDWLNQHISNAGTAGVESGLSLEPVQRMMHALGDPQHAYDVVHVTGTNGKGSTSVMASRLIEATNLSVGTYASPHVEVINERIVRNGDLIPHDELAAALTDISLIEPLLDNRPSYFEILTAAAFRWFADNAVEVAVIEVGMLGRWDATNVADGKVAVLTNVGRDHTDRSVDWRRKIAVEKVGIVKPGATLVLGEADDELEPLFTEAGAERMWVPGRDFEVLDNRLAVGGRVFDMMTPLGTRLEDVFLPLHGEHQVNNAATAVAAWEALFDHAIDGELVSEALADVHLVGRFEVVAHDPIIILDGAHNPDGAEAAVSALDAEFARIGSRILVLGLLGPKDVPEMLEALDATNADLLIACTPDSPRAIPAVELAAVAEDMGIAAEAVPNPVAAVDRAAAVSADEDIILVAGSLYIVGAVREALRMAAQN